ncbi:MAG: PglZ domain-containing protein, partial [Solirubrobacteraceae bacterium]
MNSFHEYLCGQLESLLAKRRIVVFYDRRSEFVPFFDRELEKLGSGPDGLVRVAIGERPALLARYTGSFFGLRSAVEPIVAKDEPDPLIIYLPGVERDRNASVLMEIEKGGTCYEPQLKRLALTVLRRSHTDGVIDDMLRPAGLTYDDIVHYVEEAAEGQQGSVLRAIFAGASSEGLLMQWLGSGDHDADIEQKGADNELYRLLESRLGASLPSATSVGEARVKAARYLLVNEFRGDLHGESPTSLSMVPTCPTKEHEARIRDVCSSLRRQHPDEYAALADRVESDLNLNGSDVDPNCLGTTDTFRFEELRLLAKAIELTAAKEYDAALNLALDRAHSFWVDRDIARQAEWGACRLAAELGEETTRVRQALQGADRSPTGWVKSYCAEGGWFEADRLQRRLETWIAQMDDDPEADQAVAVARKEHDDTLKYMAEGFSSALADAGWTVLDVLGQTEIYPEVVQAGGSRVAYFLVDAMRFEMGVELRDRLQGVEELTLRPAVAALPTITPVGMAALLPGASRSFSVVDGKGKLAAQIDDSVMADLQARLKFFKLAVPDLVELTLDKLLHTGGSKLA